MTAPCNVACDSGITTVNLPSGSTLQCGRWLWDDMPLNSPKRPPCWNSTSVFDFDQITAIDVSFCTILRNFIQIGPAGRKNDVISIFKMADLSHLGFYGSNDGFFEKPNYNLLNCLVSQKIAFLHFGDRQTNRQTNRRTDGQARCINRSRCRERRLKNRFVLDVQTYT